MPIPTEPIGSVPRTTRLTSTARETAFAKIKARVDGTRLAEKVLGIC